MTHLIEMSGERTLHKLWREMAPLLKHLTLRRETTPPIKIWIAVIQQRVMVEGSDIALSAEQLWRASAEMFLVQIRTITPNP
jgi:hypothetical protein